MHHSLSFLSRPSLPLALGLAALLGACASEPAYPLCRNDTACAHQGHREYCVQGHCQACRDTRDCTPPATCEANQCVAPSIARGECTRDNDCAAGQTCVSGACLASPSTVTAHSDDGQCTFPIVHFGFDDAALPEGDRPALQTAADCLQRERTTHYVLVGHADPRGTTEYNLALGERRARAVQHYLVALGVTEGRLAVSSMGSEGATGTSESGWANDRRVDPNRRDDAQQNGRSPAH